MDYELRATRESSKRNRAPDTRRRQCCASCGSGRGGLSGVPKQASTAHLVGWDRQWPVPLSVSHGPVPFLDWKDRGQPIESNPWALCPEHMGGHVTRRVGRDAHPVKVRSG